MSDDKTLNCQDILKDIDCVCSIHDVGGYLYVKDIDEKQVFEHNILCLFISPETNVKFLAFLYPKLEIHLIPLTRKTLVVRIAPYMYAVQNENIGYGVALPSNIPHQSVLSFESFLGNYADFQDESGQPIEVSATNCSPIEFRFNFKAQHSKILHIIDLGAIQEAWLVTNCIYALGNDPKNGPAFLKGTPARFRAINVTLDEFETLVFNSDFEGAQNSIRLVPYIRTPETTSEFSPYIPGFYSPNTPPPNAPNNFSLDDHPSPRQINHSIESSPSSAFVRPSVKLSPLSTTVSTFIQNLSSFIKEKKTTASNKRDGQNDPSSQLTSFLSFPLPTFSSLRHSSSSSLSSISVNALTEENDKHLNKPKRELTPFSGVQHSPICRSASPSTTPNSQSTPLFGPSSFQSEPTTTPPQPKSNPFQGLKNAVREMLNSIADVGAQTSDSDTESD
ncbi:hypothetical protein BLNAU_1812 [Blattamonas nauphoetae]|uniref:Uncharacterized protein n=1 Tax=Blattamonas nauphoetae TaxID=2049346 RepID=A0ABQ9YHP9_9EUKA|nr:hypothetical protein BLNAU_1812 [Blattamonas nauphoetae]